MSCERTRDAPSAPPPAGSCSRPPLGHPSMYRSRVRLDGRAGPATRISLAASHVQLLPMSIGPSRCFGRAHGAALAAAAGEGGREWRQRRGY